MKDYTLNDHASNPGLNGIKGNTNQQLPVIDWLADLPETRLETQLVEVQFKNTRKGYYLNSNEIPLTKGDIVAVESSPGHDIGTVTLTGRLVLAQIKKLNINLERYELKRIYRKARPVDMEKFQESKAKEHETMIRARQLANDLKLDMKIGDVEYQGDGNKAIFYYIADGRVDFRQLIKVLAEAFKVRIEMKQIGARQEAGRIGGIGPCGRELCCTTWMSSFVSVSTSAARIQDISTNPLKLAGQCAKIKCCINYELSSYTEAKKDIPSESIVLETKLAQYFHFKTDVFRRIMLYTTAPGMTSNMVALSVDRVKEIIALNKQGIKVDKIEGDTSEEPVVIDYENVVGQDSLTRFDKQKRNKKNNKHLTKRNNDNKESASQERQEQKAPSTATLGEQKTEVRKQGNTNQNNDNQQGERRNNRDRREFNHNNRNKNNRTSREGQKDERRENQQDHQQRQQRKEQNDGQQRERNREPRQHNEHRNHNNTPKDNNEPPTNE